MEFHLVEPHELRFFAITLPEEFTEVIIVPTGDVHYGNPLFSLKHYSRHLTYIHDTPNVYTVLTGDLVESSLRTSKGDIYRQVGTPQDQRDWQIEQLLPIKDKILGVCTGNHEERVNKEAGIDVSADIAQALGVPYRREGLLLQIRFGKGADRHSDKYYVFWGYCTHGWGGARTNPAKAVKVERTSTYVHADFYMMSHDHVVNVGNTVYLIPDHRAYMDKKTGFMTGKVVAHTKKLVKTNSFVKWGDYSEMGGFPPSSLETPYIKLYTNYIHKGEKGIRVES